MKTCQLSTFKERKRSLFYKGFALTAFLLLFSGISAWATHYRYGNIQWKDNGGNQVTFKIQQAWRWSYFGDPPIGSTVDIAAADGPVPFEFGDGEFVDIQIVITSINAAEDWFFGEVTFVHTYPAPGNYTASFAGCCRISTLENNADGDFRLQTIVNVGNGASSTVSTVVPIIDLPVNDAAASFSIPTVDPDGHTLTFRLANANEAAGTGNAYVQPTGLTVNPATGVVTFSTVGLTVGDLYTSQVLINNGVSEIGVDFIIRIVPNPPPSTPPYFVYPPTPANGSTLNVNAGQLLTFNIQADDNDPNSTVTLTVVGMPPGATTTPVLPTTGAANQPVSTTFNWTPAFSDVGTYILTFTATDNTGTSVSTTVNVVVGVVCDEDFSCSIDVDPSPTIPGGDPNTIYVGNGPQSVTLTASTTGGYGGNTYDWSDGSTGASITVSPTSTTTYTVIIKDVAGCTTECSVTIYVVDCVVDAGSYGPVCGNAGLIQLTGSPAGGTFSGTGVVFNNGNYYFNPSAGTQTITYTYQNGSGCTASDNTTIKVKAVPSSPSTTNATACYPNSATVKASGCNGGTLKWYDSQGNLIPAYTGNTEVTVTTTTTFYVSCTKNGCESAKVPVTGTVDACVCIYPDGTSCTEFNAGTVSCLERLCITTETKQGVTSVTNATPGSVFFYYVKINAPSKKFDVYIEQTKCGLSKNFALKKNQVTAYTNSCGQIASGTQATTTGDGTIHVTGATKNQPVIISVKYDVNSIVGATVTGTIPCEYQFRAHLGTSSAAPVIANSTAQLTVTTNCSSSRIIASRTKQVEENDNFKVKAYPNPYTTTINFQFTSPVSGKALLEAYDLVGKRLATVFEGNVNAGVLNIVKYNVPEGNKVPIMYTLTIGSYKQHGIMFPTR